MMTRSAASSFDETFVVLAGELRTGDDPLCAWITDGRTSDAGTAAAACLMNERREEFMIDAAG